MGHSKKAKRKSKLALYMEFIPFICLYKFVRMLPLKMAHGLCTSFFVLLYHVDRKHLKRSVQHLMHAGVAKNPEEAKAIAYDMYRHGGRLVTELAKLDQHYSEIRMEFSGSEEARKVLIESGENNIPAIIVTAHYGNWEVSGKFWTELSGNKLLTVVRSLDNHLIGRYVMEMRVSDMHEIIPKDQSIKRLLKALRAKECVAILADQHASTKEGVETVFFGQPARSHSSPALLHLKTGVPIAPMVLRCKEKLFNYEGVFGDIIEYTPTDDKEKDIAAVTQMYTTALEKLIAGEPRQWLWAHRRWLNINRKQRTSRPSQETVTQETEVRSAVRQAG